MFEAHAVGATAVLFVVHGGSFFPALFAGAFTNCPLIFVVI